MRKCILANIATRLSDAYGITSAEALHALEDAAPMSPNIESAMLTLERHGDSVMLVDGGDVVATLDLSGILHGIAPSCDTIDPYGDRHDLLVTTAIHDPFAPRVPPASNL